MFRILADRLNAVVRGWDCGTRQMAQIPPQWHQQACFSMPVRMRPELHDVNQNRLDNMQRACSAIGVRVLLPGQLFSLFRCIGEPSAARGYKSGPVIIRGALASSTGGGLCQIATALFNAAMMANLEIIEKHNHSTDLWGEQRMIDLGLDAIYAYAIADLKFRNSTAHPLALVADLNSAKLCLSCQLFSPVPLGGVVRIRSVPLTTPDARGRLGVQTTRYFMGPDRIEAITYQKTEYYQTKDSRT